MQKTDKKSHACSHKYRLINLQKHDRKTVIHRIKRCYHQRPHPGINVCSDHAGVINDKDILFVPFRNGTGRNCSCLSKILAEIAAPAFPGINDTDTQKKRNRCTACQVLRPSIHLPAFVKILRNCGDTTYARIKNTNGKYNLVRYKSMKY